MTNQTERPPTTVDQSGQTIYGDQINVVGSLHLTRLDAADQRNQRNHAVLRQAVRRFWIEGVLHSSLYNALLIRLGLDVRPDAVDNRPWDLILQQADQPDQRIADDKSLVEIFDEMDQQLLILGEPGSGKTTTLLALAEGLLIRTAVDPTLPTPVVFNLSSWAEKQPTLEDWLIEELNTRYQIPRKIAQQWVDNDELTLLMDGLDEVMENKRNACVEAINMFRREHVVGLVVCSRTVEYDRLTVQLKLAAAVAVRPLTLSQIQVYIAQVGTKVAGLSQLLIEHDELRELAQTPLLLSVITLSYDVLSLADGQTDCPQSSVHTQLFDRYICRMFEHRGLEHLFSPKQTVLWLRWLATQMRERSQTVFLIERIQPDWLNTGSHLAKYRLLVGLIFGLMDGLSAWLPIRGLALAPNLGITFEFRAPQVIYPAQSNSLINGLLILLIVGLIGGFHATFHSEIGAHEKLNFSWRNGLTGGLLVGLFFGFTIGLLFGSFFGLIIGIGSLGLGGLIVGRYNIKTLQELRHTWRTSMAAGLWFGLSMGLIVGLSTGLVIGPIAGLLLGLSVWLSVTLYIILRKDKRSAEAQLKVLPNQGVRQSYRNGLMFGLVGALIGGLTGMLVAGPIGGLGASISGFLMLGRFGGLTSCIRHLVLRWMFFYQRKMPWNYAHFLDYAASRLFLRKVGGGYVFVHRLLLEHFASLTDEDITRITTGIKST